MENNALYMRNPTREKNKCKKEKFEMIGHVALDFWLSNDHEKLNDFNTIFEIFFRFFEEIADGVTEFNLTSKISDTHLQF